MRADVLRQVVAKHAEVFGTIMVMTDVWTIATRFCRSRAADIDRETCAQSMLASSYEPDGMRMDTWLTVAGSPGDGGHVSR